MTIGDFKMLIEGLPDDMDIAIAIGDSLEKICYDTEIADIFYEDNDERELIFVIKPCTCDEIEEGDINSRPELN